MWLTGFDAPCCLTMVVDKPMAGHDLMQVIEEMIQMAKDMQEAMKRHEELGLNPDEEAFYDALAERPEVLLAMGDATLKNGASCRQRSGAGRPQPHVHGSARLLASLRLCGGTIFGFSPAVRFSGGTNVLAPVSARR